jgi:hypothetical protein
MSILDQLLDLYGKPTPSTLEGNDTAFRHFYSVADAPKLLFLQIEECAKIAPLGCNPYTDWQLINNAIRLLLTTGFIFVLLRSRIECCPWPRRGLRCTR